MSEKKRGFFSRLFGGSSEETQDQQENIAPTSSELRESVEGLQSVPLDPLKGLEETAEAVADETLDLENPEHDAEPEVIQEPEDTDKPHDLDKAETKALEETAYLDDDLLHENISADAEPEQDIISSKDSDVAAPVAEDTADGESDLAPEVPEASGKAEGPEEAGSFESVRDFGDAESREEPRETAAAGEAQRAEKTGEVVPVKKSWFQRLKAGLSRSSNALTEGISSIFTKQKLDADTLEELEDILIQADFGIDTAIAITDRVSDGRYDKEISGEEVRAILAEEIESVLEPVAIPLDLESGHKPHIVLMVGVNGTGKTTTIGKLSSMLRDQGKKVMLAAGDTFRAAAVEQLKVWGERTGAEVVARDTGADAAGLAYDAVDTALSNGTDVLLIDTAGRLQNKAELMDELEKIIRVIRKRVPDAPHTTLLTLDATTGQNALSQVEVFGKIAGVTGLVMTKLDGTARGGILVAIARKYKLPVHFIGVGEGVEDLEPFSAKDFAAAIAGRDEALD
ncbi:Signal recognition particle receptor FtsY [Pseudovibrio axinellae]|uniref:Signal recognition particle receptor FtsY n=1 Tax=Pseudovibrio axinellae TaxID=989403 RepID=A0A165Z989_9HYPH|nr:signal recognition particle-docking protein FtsY [Pseudovibrio axinellae]KZL19624.1 Signal recognition particle receptor FtsY [Pseudovibrio axinellae]SEQ34618.1 signal recognition particle-docking protein FtsY [Pseudovibrio axinellae]